MRILVAVDQNPETGFVVRQVADLAGNTWSNITLLGICESEDGVNELADRLNAYRNLFLSGIEDGVSPYGRPNTEYELIQQKKNVWDQKFEDNNGRKDLSCRIRCGVAGKAIVTEASEANADLIMMGCKQGTGCEWPEDAVKKVVRNAQCSVLVVKEEKKPQMIVGCLDHDTVTQASIELINQLVTLYGAELEIVGVTDLNGLPGDVDRRMAKILSYYTDQGIKAWIRSVNADSLKSFVVEAAGQNLVALWMGKESFLDKIFSRQRLVNLASDAESSILILR
jgi:nucleotide-binding universal stress UspA family protein